MRLLKVASVWLVVLAVLPTAAYAQSAIVGVVTDATGAILPGVTVEARSPVLIEQVRTVITNGQGQYRITDLRSGIYSVTFVLAGFSTMVRQGIQLEADFAATIDVQMRVGALEETVIVSGNSSIVDVVTAQRREVITREVLESIPTGRNYQTVGRTLPAVNMTRSGTANFDVGGSSTMQQGFLAAYGGRGDDMGMEVDGMSVTSMLGSGNNPFGYHNDGAYQEYVFQASGGSAETDSPGVRFNMIPRDGANRFSGDFVGLFSNSGLQGRNVTEDLRNRGVTTPGRLYRLFDINGSLGGPLKRDRLWFFTSVREWAFNTFVANALNPDGTQAKEDNFLQAYTNRLTIQANPRNKVTAFFDLMPRRKGHRDLELGGISPEATSLQAWKLGYNGQAKWTSTVTNKLLVESGYSTAVFPFHINYRPEVRLATCFAAFVACAPGTDYGDIAKVDLVQGTRRGAALGSTNGPTYKGYVTSSVSYVTGSHALKSGVQWTWGYNKSRNVANADLSQRYRNGVPDSVAIRNTPVDSATEINADIGIYVQDSWTIDRLTLSPGLRFDYLNGEVQEQNAPAGRFVPARHFERISNLPNWKNVVPRFGAAYDLFGNGRTALKGTIGKFMNQESVGYPGRYNPMVSSTDTRTWSDLNRDDIAQENEIGPTSNLAFGIRRNRNPDPNIQRPFQMLYNVTVQHELRPGVGASVGYYRRGFYKIVWTDNLATTHADYTPIVIPDPRANGQTLTVYNLDRSKLGLVNELDTNSTENTSTYNGVDFTVNVRFPNGATLQGGTSTGRLRDVTCQVDDPNNLRFCDQTQLDMPFITTFKLSGTYVLPGAWRLSGVFLSSPGDEIAVTYLVNRSIVSTLTLAQQIVQLNQPRTDFLDRINQLDLSVARAFQIRQVKLSPRVDLFNALNANQVVNQVTTFGSAFGRPLRILDPRIVRLGVKVEF